MAKYISNEEYQEILQNQFNDLTATDLIAQIDKCEDFLNNLSDDIGDDRYDFVKSIITTAKQQKELTFKQWKALSAFQRDCEKLTKVATLKKSLVVENNVKEYINSIESGMREMDTTHWTKERKEAYEQYLSKQKLEEDMAAEVEKFLQKIEAEKKASITYNVENPNGNLKKPNKTKLN
jgi:hypothetical protein